MIDTKVNGRSFYMGAEGEGNSNCCIWWHKEWDHWWIGNCGLQGDNDGYAWLDSNDNCPNNDKWRNNAPMISEATVAAGAGNN